MEEIPSPKRGKDLQVVLPHQGYMPVLRQIALFYGISLQRYITVLCQAGILSAIEEDEALSGIIKQLSPSLWAEVQERRDQ